MAARVPDATDRSPFVPDELWTREMEFVARRRNLPADGGDAPGAATRNLIGLALSGGGIRSATVSLGILQALAKRGRLRFIDYVSTASGGGYIGTFLGGLFQRWSPSSGDDTIASDDPRWMQIESVLKEPRSQPVEWLRESGRYLAPNGAADMWMALGVVLRNLVAIHVVLSTLLVAALLAGNGVRRALTFLVEHAAPAQAAGVQDLLVRRGFWWSPLIVVAGLVAALWAVPNGIGYWLVRSDDRDGKTDLVDGQPPILTLIAMMIAAAACVVSSFQGLWLYRGPWLPPLTIAVSLAASGAAWLSAVGGARSAAEARNILTLRLRGGLVLTAVIGALALLDSLGQTLSAIWVTGRLPGLVSWMGAGFSAVAGAAMFLQRVAGRFVQRTATALRVPAQVLALVAALALASTIVVSLSALAHGLTWDWTSCAGHARSGRGASAVLCTPQFLNLRTYLWALGVTALLTAAFGQTYSFVNRSSLSALYGARLARAYLGASNPVRDDPKRQNFTVHVPGDEMAFAEYKPHERGGPLHIINVTLNETIDGRSNVEQRDRKGMGLALGPAGVSVGVYHHATWQGESLRATDDPGTGDRARFRVFPEKGVFKPRTPTVGQWMAISGAAVSTGLGSRTSAGLSLLIGIFNFRLGYWFQSDVDPAKRAVRSERGPATDWFAQTFARALPVQSHLLNEFLARFPGTALADWYLSDGGHFENTAAYELIRRRLPLIVLCDNGADTSGELSDLGNLVLKVRTDFAAEVVFFDRATIDDLDQAVGRVVGTVEDLGLAPPRPVGDDAVTTVDAAAPRRPRRYATLAWIHYSDGAPSSLLLVIHPSLNGTEPVDVRSYQKSHPTFPQESTADQFFDDAQWEAYRRLGEHMGHEILAAIDPESGHAPPGDGWWPSRLPRRP
ncbi:MAG TPA: hypothetical protein VMU50_11880 [Polyangia bacterium]|nr:hypothetical protein [Polyangia bacterium]